MLRDVKLYGVLGQRFGKVHRLDVATPAEAVRALAANLPGFEQALVDHPTGFHVLAGRTDVADHERLHHPAGQADAFKIIPAVAGSKAKWLGIVLGVALIAFAITNPFGWGAIAAFGSTTIGSIAGAIGVGLVLNGVAGLLAPKTSYDAGSDAEQKQSYIFNGATNTSQQGGCVPLGYGRMIVGSVVASMGISVQELPT